MYSGGTKPSLEIGTKVFQGSFFVCGRMESLPSSVSSSPLAALLPSPGGELLLNRPLMITKERSALPGLVGRKVCFQRSGKAEQVTTAHKGLSPLLSNAFSSAFTPLIRKLIIRDGFAPPPRGENCQGETATTQSNGDETGRDGILFLAPHYTILLKDNGKRHEERRKVGGKR